MPIIRIRENTYEINRVALFDKKKMRLILEPKQTRILNQLMYKHPRFEARVTEGNLRYSLSVHKYNYRYKINSLNKERPSIDFVVNIKGTAEESEEIFFNRSWGEIEQAAERSIEKSYLELLNSVKKRQLDPLGFGLRYIATRHGGDKDWEEWRKLYPLVEFNVKVNVTLEGTGEIK